MDLLAARLAKRMDHIKYAVSLSCSKVINLDARILLDLIDRCHMSLRKINNMDIITDTCTVRCIVIIAKHTHARKLADCYLCDIWKQVVRDTLWIFSDQTTLMCTNWVEVTKQDHIPFWICKLDICQDLL